MSNNSIASLNNVFLLSVALGVLAIGLSGCSGEGASTDLKRAAGWFEEVARESGIAFVHERRANTRRFLFPEIMSGGAVWFDSNNDGLLDLYLIQGGAIDRSPQEGDPANRLFRNSGDGRFEDVTVSARVADIGYGMGGAAADYDGDGDVDLYVTNVGANVLYRNDGDGTFREVSAGAGVAHEGWGSGAGFVDYDTDGDMDLYVVNYVVWSVESNKTCLAGSEIDYCGPMSFPPAQDVLYRNEGNGSFTDVTITSGIARALGPGLGISVNDFDDNGQLDLFIANDGAPNQLWMNQGDGTFLDRAIPLGVAVNRIGMSEAGMGVSSVDFDHDGDVDLFMTHLHEETNTLYRNEGKYFVDATLSVGLAMVSHPPTGFGVGFQDFNKDGFLDLYVANGRERKAQPPLYSDPYYLPNQLFEGTESGAFVEVSPQGGTYPVPALTSRAAAFADYDNDGDVDIAVVNNDGPFHLLRNRASHENHWLLVRVLDETGADAVGARVNVRSGDRSQWRIVQTAFSYQSGNDPRVHFGLGQSSRVDELLIVWPDGFREAFGSFDVDEILHLQRGAGAVTAE